MKMMNIHEAKTHFSKIIQRILNGEVVVIGKAGKPVAKIIPYAEGEAERTPGGSWRGKIKLADDFDALPPELEDAFYGTSD